MISQDDLATLQIRRVIFHDVPTNRKGGSAEPILAEGETEIDSARRGHLKVRLVRVLGSKRTYPILFNAESKSPIPAQVRSFTKHHHGGNSFVGISQEIARHLFDVQYGPISPGLLCVVDIAASGLPGLVLMKLEREEGARLELTEKSGKKAFAMSVLDNLVLTDGTRLFKTAMFLRTGAGDDDFRSAVCENQLQVTASEDIARFWMRFLGCAFVVEPRVMTQRFYSSALDFINLQVTDAVDKNDLYEHLQSQMKAEKKTFSPKSFIEDYVPEGYHQAFRERLNADKVPLTSFPKDVADIQPQLRRLAYHTARGVTVQVPAENREIVDVQSQKIIVNDMLSSVDRK